MKLRLVLAAVLLATAAACSSPVAPTMRAPTLHRDGTPADTTRPADSPYTMGSGS